MHPLQDKLSQGITALKAGNKSEAEQILKEVVQQTPQDVDAWLWLGASVSTPNETLYCLERVLELDPDNQKAQAGVQWARTGIGQGQLGAVNPLSNARLDVQNTDLPESLSVSVSGGADTPENEVRSQLDQNAEIGALPPQATAAPTVQPTNHFYLNLIIATLVIILLLGILFVVVLLRAWLG